VLPSEVVKPIPIEITTDQFTARLKQGGTLTLDGTALTIAPPSATKHAVAFMALDRLELKNGAKIITNGNVLSLFVNTLESEDGQILSFDPSTNKATKGPAAVKAAGAGGNPGDPGVSGGVVSVHVIQKLDGRLTVDLHGQDGGDGSDGQKGGTPGQASRGEDAQDGPGGVLTVGWCKKGGSDGQPGYQGLQGGAAGAGGRGGDGGYFELINVGPQPIPAVSYSFSANPGTKGKVGTPGEGGDGGLGGIGGHGSTYCGGGRQGPTGPKGPGGPLPLTAPDAAPGNSLVRNLDMEVVIRSSVIVPSAPK
jgi:hypothetical protein